MAHVDMMDAAFAAQEVELQSFKRGGGIKLVAPAKVNLFLDIGEKRADGYHDAISIMHALMLHDVLWMRKATSEKDFKYIRQHRAHGGEAMSDCAVSGEATSGAASAETNASAPVIAKLSERAFEGIPPLEIEPERNIVWKAITRLAAVLVLENPTPLFVHLEKHIPSQAGLGGGSADAAAALLGAAALWGVPKDDPRIESVAQELGADVAFFLYGGCTCLRGVGDTFDHALEPMRAPIVLVKPDFGVSTAQSYAAFDEAPYPLPDETVAQALAATAACDVPLANNLAYASESLSPDLADIRSWLADQPGVQGALMSGSGSATFALCETFDQATAIATQAQKVGLWSRATLLGSYKAAIVPAR